MEKPNNIPLASSERRTGKDRRVKPTSPFSLASIRGFRKTIRRNEDRKIHYYVDLYGPDEGLLFIFILILSVADAFLTLELVGSGMQELNSVMAYYLRLGPLPFVLIKYLLTAIGLIFLFIHKNYAIFCRQISVKAIMIAVAVMYTALITYELLLFRQSGYFSTLALSMRSGLTGTF
jgi:hypothetical protein